MGRDDCTRFRALLRVSLLEALAYRGQMLVWVLTSTMPLIMLALFGAVAAEAPLGRYGQAELVTYFLATFIVRQLTSSWVSWQINAEIQDGTLAARLLPGRCTCSTPTRPTASPRSRCASPCPSPWRPPCSPPRALQRPAGGSSPVAPLRRVDRRRLAHLALRWSCAIGALAFFLESSAKVMDLWLAAFFVFSGYLVPASISSPGLRGALDYLPFRYQIGLPVELLTGAHGRAEALALVWRQWAFVVGAGALGWSRCGRRGWRASPPTEARCIRPATRASSWCSSAPR